MDVFLLGIVIFVFIFSVGMFGYLYNAISINSRFLFELSELVSRTFRQYYANEDIEPVVVNNGIDLVWSGKVDGTFDDENKLGFITILTNGANVNSPIRDHKEADILAGKILYVVHEYIKERDSDL